MRVLLDTHAFLWFIAGSPMLGQRAKTCRAGYSYLKWHATQ